jgi:hypothetical protein
MKLIQMLVGKSVSQAISVAAELGVADVLQDAPKHVEELAAATATHAPSLYRLLRALASIGIFVEIEDHQFGLTPLAACLRGDAPDSIRNFARWYGVPLVLRAWDELLHSVKTGETGVKQALGVTDPFAYMSEHPEQEQIFQACMTEISRNNMPGIVGHMISGASARLWISAEVTDCCSPQSCAGIPARTGLCSTCRASWRARAARSRLLGLRSGVNRLRETSLNLCQLARTLMF